MLLWCNLMCSVAMVAGVEATGAMVGTALMFARDKNASLSGTYVRVERGRRITMYPSAAPLLIVLDPYSLDAVFGSTHSFRISVLFVLPFWPMPLRTCILLSHTYCWAVARYVSNDTTPSKCQFTAVHPPRSRCMYVQTAVFLVVGQLE